MGQKVNPVGLRLGINRGWDSVWYAKKKDFGKFLIEDFKIREYIKKNVINSGVSKVMIERTSKKCFVPLTVGGGVRSIEDINKLLNCGADKVSINTAAVENSAVVKDSSKKFGSQCIVVAIDAKKNGDKWEIFTHGGRNNTGINAIEFAKKMEESGAGELLVTSMDHDGTQVGYDIELMAKISSLVNIPVIASGGVGNLDHLVEGIKLGNASAVLAASIFHYGKYSVKEAKEYLDSKGIPVRI